MNRNYTNISNNGGSKNFDGLKSLTPAVLGVSNSHGIKLSLNMTSENKKELFAKLEEWRQAKREKLAARILARQKQIEKPRTSVPALSLKTKPLPIGHEGGKKVQDRESVFERLYKNSGKIKNREITINSRKEKTESSNKNVETGPFIKKGNEKEQMTHKEFSVEIQTLDSVNHTVENKNHTNKEDFGCIIEKDSSKAINLIIPESHLKNDQVNNAELKSIKTDLASKNLLFKVSSKATEAVKQKNPLRRSISMMFRQKRGTDFGVLRSVSAQNLHQVNLKLQETDNKSLQTLTLSQSFRFREKKIKNEEAGKSVSFITPRYNGPLTATHLRTKLENWLNVNGHSLEGYRHLRCFGLVNGGKSFPKTSAVSSDNSFENSYYATAPNTPVNDSEKKNITPPPFIKNQVDVKDVENWLKELHRLIAEVKYPSERCEEWLAAIRRKYENCTQLPIYWECLAALHESKGDLKSAIEDYERAIVKGGEVDAVGNSLAELFDKLVIEQKKSSQRKLEKGLDPKNIFKSTIIKFALQQKALKKLSSEIEPNVREQLYIATPVRRSTRIQTPFKSTEVDSLQNLTPELLKNVEFKPNESLLSGN